MQRELATDIGGNAEDHVSLRKREKHAKLTASVRRTRVQSARKGKPAETSWFTGTSGRHTTRAGDRRDGGQSCDSHDGQQFGGFHEI